MTFVEWKDEYNVGDPLMDTHHRQFFNLVRELDHALKSGKEGVDRKAVLKFLIKYLKMHLQAEERLLENIGYPETKEHRAKHQEFEKKIRELEWSFDNDSDSLDMEELFSLIQNWLLTHILEEDKKYSTYI